MLLIVKDLTVKDLVVKYLAVKDLTVKDLVVKDLVDNFLSPRNDISNTFHRSLNEDRRLS